MKTKRQVLFLLLSILPLAASANFTESVKKHLLAGVQQDLASRMELPASSFQVSFSALSIKPEPMKKLQSAKILSVEVLGLDSATARRFNGFTSFPFLLKTNVGTFEFKAKGLLAVTGPVFIARVPLARDSIIKADDIHVTRIPWKQLGIGAATFKSKDMLNKRISRFIQAGGIIYPSSLEAPYAVNAGDLVDLVVVSGPGVMISSRAKAKEAGHIGDSISLIQPQTQKKLRAVVTAEKKVELRL